MGVVVEVGVVVVRWQWRWRPIHLSSSSLRLSHSSSCTSKMRDESDAIASGSSADTSTSRCGSRIGRSSEASKASGSSWGRGGAGVRRRCRESRRAGVAVVEAHLRSVGGTQSHRSAPRRRRAAACAVERNGARLAQRPSHYLRRRAAAVSLQAERWRRGGGTRTCSPREQCGKDRSETRRPAQRADRLLIEDAKLFGLGESVSTPEFLGIPTLIRGIDYRTI